MNLFVLCIFFQLLPNTVAFGYQEYEHYDDLDELYEDFEDQYLDSEEYFYEELDHDQYEQFYEDYEENYQEYSFDRDDTITVNEQQGTAETLSSVGFTYPSLPSGAFKVQVRKVDDGDTLTLDDGRRVRLLGMDAPEINKQGYALEAKMHLMNHCDKQHVWLSYDPGQDREDPYGRLLAFVWVKQGNGYQCVNEGIVAAGLARTYIPNQNSKPSNWNKLIALQVEAHKAKRGLWSTFDDIIVVKTANGAAYHKRSCGHLHHVRNLFEMKASEAAAMGLHPCRTCFA